MPSRDEGPLRGRPSHSYNNLPKPPPGHTFRSETEPVPDGFTKEEADTAELMAMTATAGCEWFWPSPHAVCGAILQRYKAMGGRDSWLGLPNSPEYTNPDGIGKRSQFLNGSIYWHPSTGAHPVTILYMTKWNQLGWETGWLGYPTAGEVGHGPFGSQQEFQGAGLFWSQPTGVYAVGGAIRAKYDTVGGATGFLGYPTSDELTPPDGVGRFNTFQRGSIYWHPIFGAHPVHGVILAVWGNAGFEAGQYGYPIADETSTSTETNQQFQHGHIAFSLQNPVAQDFHDCKLNTEWPHVSSHVDNTVNVVTTGTCTHPKRKVSHTTQLVHTPECGFGTCVLRTRTSGDSKGDGVNAVIQEDNWSSTNMECQPGKYRAETKWTIVNADGGVLETVARTPQVQLGTGTGGLDKNCDRSYN
ncbi:LGFP repeat-containing protein [Hoyosella subflava]|nr:hypothetical protein [Hoyosella subflava]